VAPDGCVSGSVSTDDERRHDHPLGAVRATVLLGVATVLAGAGAMAIFARDLVQDTRSRRRVVAEAAIPLLLIAVLVWWSWSAL